MTPETPRQPTLGLALSGSGNRTSFYIGFLEVFAEKNVKIDYIAACSGGSLVAAAYACGTLPEFKQRVFSLNREELNKYFVRSHKRGGFFSMEVLETEIRKFTKDMNFEDVRPLMGFVAVDIKTGEKILLSMGEIAKAAVVSCTLPGVFEPVMWGGKTLVDGGLLTMVPGDFLRQANMDVTVGINMRGTKHIFTEGQITMKKIYNFVKKVLLIDQIDSLLDQLFQVEEDSQEEVPGFFEVIGKSLDLAIKANKTNVESSEVCDIMILPNLPRLKNSNFTSDSVKYYYDMGRKIAEENLPKIEQLIKEKTK